jgi:hypothetical protein
MAQAQDITDPASELYSPEMVAPSAAFPLESPAEVLTAPVPFSPSGEPPAQLAAPLTQYELVLEARLMTGGEPVPSGLVWRVFGTVPQDGELPLIAQAEGGTTTLNLPGGEYLIHAAFGRAGATKRVSLGGNLRESVVLDAGGLKVDAVVGDDRRIDAEQVTYEILQEDSSGELITVVPEAAAGRVIRLSAGTYHVISRYGTVNAVVRADIEVEAGKLTEAVMRHTGAEVTLKLVAAEGGEALANTRWTVSTQDGNTLHEATGAFPSIVLASGTYTAIAEHQSAIYSRDFTVEAGINRDVEVRLIDLVAPESAAPESVAATPAD